jgi:hypothetical protein
VGKLATPIGGRKLDEVLVTFLNDRRQCHSFTTFPKSLTNQKSNKSKIYVYLKIKIS